MTTKNTRLLLVADVVENPDHAFDTLLTELSWAHRSNNDVMVPRKEYYHSMQGHPYTYGNGAGARTYESMPTHPLIESVRTTLNNVHPGVWDFDVMFANLYENQHHHLGWHADDSPEMDPEHPIVTVSLGAEREIWFKSQYETGDVQKILLPHGSALIMLPGVQQSHFHRIPKHDRPCGPRLSLTFRKYREPISG